MTRLMLLLFALFAFAPQNATAAEVAAPASKRVPTEAELELAKKHYADGQQAFAAQAYDAAAVEFKAGYELSPEPEFLFNLSVVRERQGKYQEALDYAQKYRQQMIQALKPGENLAAQLDDESRGRIARLRELVAPTSTAPIQIPPQPPTKPNRAVKKFPRGAVVLFAIGGASLIAAGGCAIGSLIANDTINNGGPFYANEYSDLVSRGTSLDRATIATGAIGAAALVGATIWTLVYRFK